MPSFLTVVGLPGLDGLIDLEEGRLPDPGLTDVALDDLPASVTEPYVTTLGFTPGERGAPQRAELVEVVLETSAAVEMNIPVDSYVALSATSYGNGSDPAILHVVGTYVAADPFPSPLDDADTARLPAIDPTPDAKSVRASALAADPGTVLGATWEGQPDLRWTFDPVARPDDRERRAADRPGPRGRAPVLAPAGRGRRRHGGDRARRPRHRGGHAARDQ